MDVTDAVNIDRRPDLQEPVFTEHYSFHGIGLEVAADHPAIIDGLESCLRHFVEPRTVPPEIRMDWRSVPSVEDHLVQKPPGHSRHVYDPLEGEVVYVGNQLFVNYGDRGRVLCDPEQGRACVSILESEVENAWFVSHPMFMLAFMELLKHRGLYSLHAAGLCSEGRGILFPGTSSSGKSTLAVALLREGLGFLGDDTVFIAREQDGLTIRSFPDVIDPTDASATMFEELRHLLDGPGPENRAKYSVRAEDVYQADFIAACQPELLLFPRVSGQNTSVVTPIGKDEALRDLVPNVMLTDTDASQAHLDILSDLVRSTRTFRLETGRALTGLRELVESLLD